jgi:hypothetical protein
VKRILRGAAPGLALVVVWCVATTIGPLSDTSVSDLYLYGVYADLIRHGATPFSDFGFEYPPLALLPIMAGRWLGGNGAHGYAVAFGGLMLVCALVTQWAVGAIAGRRAAWLMALMPILVGALVRTHLDFFPTALAMCGLLALLRQRPVLAFTLLGLGTATKLVPGLIALVAVAWLLGRGERRAVAQGVAAFVVVVVVVLAPFSAHGLQDAVRFHLDRPVQIESTPASVLWITGGSYVTGTNIHPDQYKSNGLAGGHADAVQSVFGVLLVLALIGIVVLAARRHEERDLVLLAFAALLAYVSLGKVLSPQYLVWLYPFAAIAWAWPRPVRTPARIAADLVVAAGVIGLVYFPSKYFDLVLGDRSVAALVALRNGLLLAATVLIVALVAEPVRSRLPTATARTG